MVVPPPLPKRSYDRKVNVTHCSLRDAGAIHFEQLADGIAQLKGNRGAHVNRCASADSSNALTVGTPLMVVVSEGAVRLHLAEANSVNHRLSMDDEGRAVMEIPAVTLDGWLRTNGVDRVDFIKLDIEGAGTRALAGMVGAFTENPDLRMVLEFSPYNLSQYGGCSDTYFALLEGLGLKLGEIEEYTTRDPSPAVSPRVNYPARG